jgi:hypothetical protein
MVGVGVFDDKKLMEKNGRTKGRSEKLRLSRATSPTMALLTTGKAKKHTAII